MRRRFSAPHGFAVNGNLNKVVDFDAPYLQLAPRQPLGNHAGRLAVYKPFTGSPGVLLITTQGRPAHLTCGQTIACIIISPRGCGKKGNYALFPVKMNRSKPNNASCRLKEERQLAAGLVLALFPKPAYCGLFSRSLRRERTRMAGVHFSSYK